SVRLTVNSLNISKATDSSIDIPCAANIQLIPHMRGLFLYVQDSKQTKMAVRKSGRRGKKVPGMPTFP
ncbi:hypothetical protein, partial [Rhizobium laguerreae]|uniref:hypothetical protein n=1 Tax=Rhizobium laguerreae TaxID=1076926 RepID=UPI0019803BAB